MQVVTPNLSSELTRFTGAHFDLDVDGDDIVNLDMQVSTLAAFDDTNIYLGEPQGTDYSMICRFQMQAWLHDACFYDSQFQKLHSSQLPFVINAWFGSADVLDERQVSIRTPLVLLLTLLPRFHWYVSVATTDLAFHFLSLVERRRMKQRYPSYLLVDLEGARVFMSVPLVSLHHCCVDAHGEPQLRQVMIGRTHFDPELNNCLFCHSSHPKKVTEAPGFAQEMRQWIRDSMVKRQSEWEGFQEAPGGFVNLFPEVKKDKKSFVNPHNECASGLRGGLVTNALMVQTLANYVDVVYDVCPLQRSSPHKKLKITNNVTEYIEESERLSPTSPPPSPLQPVWTRHCEVRWGGQGYSICKLRTLGPAVHACFRKLPSDLSLFVGTFLDPRDGVLVSKPWRACLQHSLSWSRLQWSLGTGDGYRYEMIRRWIGQSTCVRLTGPLVTDLMKVLCSSLDTQHGGPILSLEFYPEIKESDFHQLVRFFQPRRVILPHWSLPHLYLDQHPCVTELVLMDAPRLISTASWIHLEVLYVSGLDDQLSQECKFAGLDKVSTLFVKACSPSLIEACCGVRSLMACGMLVKFDPMKLPFLDRVVAYNAMVDFESVSMANSLDVRFCHVHWGCAIHLGEAQWLESRIPTRQWHWKKIRQHLLQTAQPSITATSYIRELTVMGMTLPTDAAWWRLFPRLQELHVHVVAESTLEERQLPDWRRGRRVMLNERPDVAYFYHYYPGIQHSHVGDTDDEKKQRLVEECPLPHIISTTFKYTVMNSSVSNDCGLGYERSDDRVHRKEQWGRHGNMCNQTEWASMNTFHSAFPLSTFFISRILKQ